MKGFTLFLIFLVIVLILLVAGVIVFWNPTKAPAPTPTPTPTPAQQTVTPQPTATETVKVASGTNGQYLVDTRGMTLYYFTKNTAGKNNCTGACASVWPVFYTESVVVSPPLLQSDFAMIVASGSAQQSTYKGQPLYYYSKDANPGDILGNGVNGFWFLVKP